MYGEIVKQHRLSQSLDGGHWRLLFQFLIRWRTADIHLARSVMHDHGMPFSGIS